MKLNDIEFRYSSTNKKWELFAWFENNKATGYVIAFFDKDNEGYNMRTVGDRFFQYADAWIVGKHAMSFLQDLFDRDREATDE